MPTADLFPGSNTHPRFIWDGEKWRQRAMVLLLDAALTMGTLLVVGRFWFAQQVALPAAAALLGLVLLGHALAGRYRLARPGIIRRAIQAVIGGVLACIAVTWLFDSPNFHPEFLTAFLVADGVLLGTIHLLNVRLDRREAWARRLLAAAAFFHLFNLWFSRGALGAGDGYWYSAMVADFVAQWRAGLFPAFVGATEYAFNGAVFPHRFAPLLQYAAGVLDLLTWHQLPYLTLLNLTLLLSAVGGFFSARFCARRILPDAPWTVTGLALLYVGSPAVLGLLYTGALFMSAMTLPFVPLVVLAVWRTGDLDEPLPIAASVCPLAAAWLCHPPIALWLHALLAAALFVRWLRLWRSPGRAVREAVGVGLLFLALGSFTFVSALTVGPESGVDVREVSLNNIISSFPAVLKPVSASAAQISDYQLGLGLWPVLLLALVWWLRRRDLRSGLMLAAAIGLMILLLPVPGITAFIWHHLPRPVIDATYQWPMQRLAIIFAGVAALAVAASWRNFPRRVATVAGIALWLGVVWSQFDDERFVRRGEQMFTPPAVAERNLALNNLVPTRYAFLRFPAYPAYYSHGYMDPVLEHRLLAADGERELLTNRDAILRQTPTVSTLQSKFDGVSIVVLKPDLVITPGVRHYYRLEWLSPPPIAGTIVINTPTVTRVYALPDTGLGMTYQNPSRAFGLLPGNTDGFPTWILGSQPENLDIRFILPEPPKTAPTGLYLRVRDYPYQPDKLPIRVKGLAPYRVAVDSPEAGFLETPRMFLDGYRATVNGQAVSPQQSRDGLVIIPVPRGPSEITLTFSGTLIFRFTYWVALISWVVIGFRAAGNAWRNRASARVPASA